MTSLHLSEFCPDSDTWLAPLNDAMTMFEINTASRMKMFLAQVAHESQGFSLSPENMNYSAAGLLDIFKHNAHRFTPQEAADYARQPERIANHIYADMNGNGDEASGDGWLYRGRPLIGLTSRGNYERCGRALGVDLINSPELLETPEYAAKSAAWFWSVNGLNQLADANNFDAITKRINPGMVGQDKRVEWLTKVDGAFT